jgi:predicted alpha/beta hydrolase family esterase
MSPNHRPPRQSDPRLSLLGADLLIVPGRGGSNPGHWQSHFERRHGHARRVLQEDWHDTRLDRWAERVAEAAHAARRPVLVVAHSFGCLATVRAASRFAAPIAGALLVAPADPARFGIADSLLRQRLAAASLVVASDNDPWLSAGAALGLAESWGSGYLNLGLVGHINVASGFGDWPAAERLAAALCEGAAPERCRPEPSRANPDLVAYAV